MAARLQRVAVGLLWLAALAWFAWQGFGRHWWSATLGAALLLNLQPLVLAFEFFVLVPWHNRRDALPAASLAQLARAWWRESVTAHDVFGWQQPFHEWRHEDRPEPAVGRTGVVLVHGFFCNRAVWNRWMPALRTAGVPYLAVTLEPPFGSIDGYAEQIDAAIRRVAQTTGVPPVVVAHSMGGIAVRAWCRAHGPAAAVRVASVVTIGTPHLGTFAARFSRAANARQMVPGSAWLCALSDAEGAGLARLFTCFYSHCDNIVLPASNGTLPGADNRHVAGEPHVALIHAPQIWDEVMRRVGTDGARSSTPAVRTA